jgi:ubiquinol-cytochrome c reductase cytochrome b subunit
MSLRRRIGDWLDERTGHRKLMAEALDEPVPGGARYAYVWGSALTMSLVVQALTGWLLMTAYAPSATTAWSSVMYISYQMSAGWLIRGLHHFGAQAMVILLGLHLVQTAVFGAYKKPREMNWLLGLGLMGLTLGFALTGYLLPWDQKGYWATKVATNIAGTFPVVGEWTQRMLVGGSDYGHLTLTRFYTLHVGILPLLTLVLLGAHIALFRKHGVTPPPSADTSKVDSFYPKQVGKDLLVAGVVLALLFWLSYRGHGAHLDAPADPASNYPARPEWYFLALFEALKHVPGNMEWVIAAGIPLLLGGYLVALPFLDNKPGASLRARLPWLAPLALIGVAAAGLTYLSLSTDANDPAFQEARDVASKKAEYAISLAKQGVPPAGPLAMLANDPNTRGPELFAKHCAACHRLGAQGPEQGKDTAPDLTGFGTAAWVVAVLDHPDAPTMFGNTPFKGMMPSFTKAPEDPEAAKYFTAMSKADQTEVANFLVAQAQGKDGKGMKGEKLVKDRCTSCHRLDGETDDEDSVAPELRGWASKKWIELQIRNPGNGRSYPAGAMDEALKGHMPAFEEQMSSSDITLLTGWLHQAASGKTASEK